MKRRIIWLLAAAFVLGFTACACAEGEDVEFHSAIARYMKDYQYILSADIEAQIIRTFEPQMVHCGAVQVRFEEILYDGQWVYTVAAVTPTDPSATLVIPGEAGLGERMNGDDSRTYRTAALEDEKELIGVYVYPAEFEGVYFVDHFRETDGTTLLLSGSKIGIGNAETTITWQVKIYHIDPYTAEHTFLQTTTYPTTIQPPQTYVEQTYVIQNDELQPFRHLKLVQTSLNTYLFPAWEGEEARYQYHVTLLEADGRHVELGAPPDMEAYALEGFPETLTISIVDATTGGFIGTYEFAAQAPASFGQ